MFATLHTQNSNNTHDFIVTVLTSAAVVIIMIGFVRYRQRHKRRGTNEAGSQYRKPQRIRQGLPLPGAQFEAQVYDALVKHDFSARLIVNALFARPEAINCFFEIDILIISHRGIHVLELKDWHTFVSGELKDKAWMVGKLESGFLHYPKEVYSPHKQNEKHIEDLNALYPFA